MVKRKMKEGDLEALMTHYRSERRRLVFQLAQVRNALRELKKTKATLPKAPPKPSIIVLPDGTTKRRPGRPRKGEVVQTKTKRGPGRPPKLKRQARPLNKWDEMVIAAIKTSGMLLLKSELLKHAIHWAGSNEPRMKRSEIETMLTRTLQKLTDRKNLLGTYHSGLCRGNHYGLKEWFFISSGRLRRQHLDRLVLVKGDKK